MNLSICAIASEVTPLAKTGGLADVASALTRQLTAAGHDVRLFVPLYSSIARQQFELHGLEFLSQLPVQLGAHRYEVNIWSARLPGSATYVYLVECEALYARPRLYTQDPDEHRRFLALTRAALEACRKMQFRPDIVHCHDWHAAFAPLWLRTLYANDSLLATAKSVLTIHNLGYQGEFAAAALSDLSLQQDARRVHQEDLQAGRINSLKHGILYADAITTVSPTYAREICTPQLGMGLQQTLLDRGTAVHGILNGVDYEEWDPRWDRHLPRNYGRFELERKLQLKQQFLAHHALAAAGPRTPLLGIVSRMTVQKGFDLLLEALPALLASRDIRLAVLGSGDARYEDFFRTLAAGFADQVIYQDGYDEPLAHMIEAASDVFLMPSLYEPCGLNQMYSLRYGTIPIVRRTGGLADSVQHFNPTDGSGNGIVFNDYDVPGLRWAIDTALAWYADPVLWNRMVQNAMCADYSWSRQGAEYIALFERLLEPVGGRSSAAAT